MPTSAQATIVDYKTWDFRVIVYGYVTIIETNSSVIGMCIQSTAVEHCPVRRVQKQLGRQDLLLDLLEASSGLFYGNSLQLWGEMSTWQVQWHIKSGPFPPFSWHQTYVSSILTQNLHKGQKTGKRLRPLTMQLTLPGNKCRSSLCRVGDTAGNVL